MVTASGWVLGDSVGDWAGVVSTCLRRRWVYSVRSHPAGNSAIVVFAGSGLLLVVEVGELGDPTCLYSQICREHQLQHHHLWMFLLLSLTMLREEARQFLLHVLLLPLHEHHHHQRLFRRWRREWVHYGHS